MKVTILGCGGSAGVPMIGGEERQVAVGIWGKCDPTHPRNIRTRSSIMIEHEGFRLLVDSGPDLRHQMLSCSLSHVDAVIYTHAHRDHIAGLDELRAVNRVIGKPLPLFATKEVLAELKASFPYAFRPWNGGGFFRPVFDAHMIEMGQTLTIGPLHGIGFEQRHGQISSLGVRFGSCAYCTDVEHFPYNNLEYLNNLDVWIVDCFQHDAHPAHAWLERVLEWREKINPKHTILTHMGPDMDYMSLKKSLPKGVKPAWDGMCLNL